MSAGCPKLRPRKFKTGPRRLCAGSRKDILYEKLIPSDLPLYIFPKGFAGLFTTDAALLDFTKRALRIYLACLFLFGIQISCQMAFNSIGYAKESIMVAVMRKFVLLIPLIYIIPRFWTGDQVSAVYMAEPVADFFAVSFTVFLFRKQFKKALESIRGKKDVLNASGTPSVPA